MKVLVLSEQFPNPREPVRGVYVVEQMRALRAQGIEMSVIAPVPWAPRILGFLRRARKYSAIPLQTTKDGFEVEHPRIPTLPGGHLFSLSGVLLYLRCLPAIRKQLAQQPVDLIHAHTIMPAGFAAVLLGKKFKVPVVCTVHGSDVKLYPWKSWATRVATKWALRRVDRLIVVSDDLKQAVFRLVGDRQVCVARNGADGELFQPLDKNEARERLELPRDRKIVLFVGNLFTVKGAEFLLEAFAQIEDKNAFLYLVGAGYLRAPLGALAERLGIADRCHFVGQRPHEQIRFWFSAADCLVLPSLSEGLPTVVPEAMMCGTPVIATSVGGIPEIVKDRETGLLVPPKDPPALAQAIDQILSDPRLAQSMADRAKQEVESEFTWGKNADKTQAIYRELA